MEEEPRIDQVTATYHENSIPVSPDRGKHPHRTLRYTLIAAIGALLITACMSEPRPFPGAVEATRAAAFQGTTAAQTPVPIQDTPTPIEINWRQDLGFCLSSHGFQNVRIHTGSLLRYSIPSGTNARTLTQEAITNETTNDNLEGTPSASLTATDPDGKEVELIVFPIDDQTWRLILLEDAQQVDNP